jgi:phosphohistidine phosphatase
LTGWRAGGHGDDVSKRLLIARHAKSSWADPELDDHDRPLKGRGRRAAVAVGRHLHDAGLLPDLVLCSSAVRARQTLERFRLPPATRIQVEPPLYGAHAEWMLDRLRSVPDAIGSVLLIGHNPGVEDLVARVVADRRDVPARFPTGAVADVRLPITTWTDLAPHIGEVRDFVVPRELENTD